MTDDKDRRIQDLEKAIKVQANALRAYMAYEKSELKILRKHAFEASLAINQLDSEREMNKILTDEVEELRSRLGSEAADERAKIVAWIKMVKDEYQDPYVAELADRVEAEEHVK